MLEIFRMFRKRIPRGAIGWLPPDFAELTLRGACGLASLVNAICEAATLPHVAVPAFMCTLSKPHGGRAGHCPPRCGLPLDDALAAAEHGQLTGCARPPMGRRGARLHALMAALARHVPLESGARLGLARGRILRGV